MRHVRLLGSLLLLPCLGLLALPARAEEPTPQTAATVAVHAGTLEPVVGEPVTVVLTVRYRPDWFRRHAAPLFRRPLDLDVQLAAPWLAAIDGAVVVPAPPGSDAEGDVRYVRLALDGEVASLVSRPVADAPGWAELQARLRLIPTRAGTLELAAPTLTYAFAEVVEENLLGERSARDTTSITIRGEPLRIVAREPPAEGRPDGYQGAVGRFTLEARVDDPRVTLGEPFDLTLVIAGEGNLGLVPQPRLDGVAGLHVYGAAEDPPEGPTQPRRVIRYEVALTDPALDAVPPIPFPFYDPARGYAVARSAAVRLEVTRPEGGAAAAEVAPPASSEEAPASEGRRRPSVAFLALAVLAGLVVIGGGGALLWRLRPRRQPAPAPRPTRPGPASAPPAPPPGPARAEALRVLRASLADADLDARYRAYVDFLAAHLGCGPGSVVGEDLAVRLAAAGVAQTTATRAAEAMDALVAARYGAGETAGPDAELVTALADALA